MVHRSRLPFTYLTKLQLHPDTDFSQLLDGTVEIETLVREGKPGRYPRPATKEPSAAPISFASSNERCGSAPGLTLETGLDSSDDEQPRMMGATLSERLERLEIDPSSPRFKGESSGVRLVYSAFALKNELSGKPSDHRKPIATRRPEFWSMSPVRPSPSEIHALVLTDNYASRA